MLILNTGGTFNKRYNPLSGDMQVPFDNSAADRILQTVDAPYDFSGVMYKDSLDMSMNDRKMLVNIIMESSDDKFIIIHGTDTMRESAEFLATILMIER
jgi:L-asparaginase